jgi:hypothetical protein
MLELPEDPSIGAAFQQHKLRRWLRENYYPDGTDHVRPVRPACSHACSVANTLVRYLTRWSSDACIAILCLQFLAPFKWLNTHLGGLGNAPGAEVPHEHTVSGLPEPEWEKLVAERAQRHLRVFRQPNVDPSQSLVRDTRPIREQLLHKGDPAENRHLRDAEILYRPHPPAHA